MSAKKAVASCGKNQQSSSYREKLGQDDQLARQIVKYAYERCPTTRERLDKAGVKPSEIRGVKDLGKIPIIVKEDLIDLQRASPPFGGLNALPDEELWKVFLSAGPIYDAYGPLSEAHCGALKVVLRNAGVKRGDIIINTASFHQVNFAWTGDEVARQLGIVSIPFGPGNSEQAVKVMHEVKATVYYGFPNHLMNLIKKAEEMGYNWHRDFVLRIAVVSGEPLLPSSRKIIEEKYGVSVFNIFGTAECDMVAYECLQKSGMHISEGVIIEIVDVESRQRLPPGEIGELVVTTSDEAMPFVRLGLGDTGYYIDEPCACGCPSARIYFASKARDILRVKGRLIYPKVVEKTLAQFPEISQYQLIGRRPAYKDELAVKIELANKTVDKEALLKRLGEAIRATCGCSVDTIEYVTPGTIAPGSKALVDERTWE